MDFIAGVLAAIAESEADGRLLELEGVTGYSGDRLIGLLQRCARLVATEAGASYLEIGVFQGLTLTSVAAAAPDLPCFGIDNFSQFDPENRNRGIVESRLARHTKGNATLIDQDFEDALLTLDQRIGELRLGCYFVDGPHDYRSQYLCLDFARRHLADDVVILVDDSNYEHVRRANRDWLLANPEFALVFDTYSQCHPMNLADAAQSAARSGWWNGLNVIVRDAEHRLERILPPVDESRERYFNDHVVHAARHAELAPGALHLLNGSLPRSVLRLLRQRARRTTHSSRFTSMNTYSAAIEGSRRAQFAGSGQGAPE